MEQKVFKMKPKTCQAPLFIELNRTFLAKFVGFVENMKIIGIFFAEAFLCLHKMQYNSTNYTVFYDATNSTPHKRIPQECL